MSQQPHRLGLFPGSFDPITNGHVDVIRRGSRLFDVLVIGVGENPTKQPLLSVDERVEIIRQVVADLPNVRVQTYGGLTVDFARRLEAAAIIRGLRNTTDLHFEFQLAMTNRFVAGVETVFILTANEYAFTSSGMIKQVAQMGGDVSAMVPPQVLPYIQARCRGGADQSLIEPA